jgi:hypothetical protein
MTKYKERVVVLCRTVIFSLLFLCCRSAEAFSVVYQNGTSVVPLAASKSNTPEEPAVVDGLSCLNLKGGGMRSYALANSFRGTEGSMEFDLVMLGDEKPGLTSQQIMMMYRPGFSDYRFSITYLHLEHALQVEMWAKPALASKYFKAKVRLPWEKGKKYPIVLDWRNLGQNRLELILSGNEESASTVVPADGFPDFERLLVGCNPWGKVMDYHGLGLSTITVKNVAGPRKPSQSESFAPSAPPDGTESERVAVIHAPKGRTDAVHILSDIRYAFNNDLNSSWYYPTDGGKAVYITIDMQHPSVVTGWKLAALFPRPTTQPSWDRDSERNLCRPLGRAAYRAEYSLDGQSWKRLYTADPKTLIYPDRYHQVVLPAPVTTRFLRLGYQPKTSYQGFGAVADMVILGDAGHEVPACARRRSINRMLSDLEGAGFHLSYVRKAGQNLSDNYHLVFEPDINPLAEKIRLLKKDLEAVSSINDTSLAGYQADVAAAVKQAASFYAGVNSLRHAAVYSELVDTAERRVRVMGSSPELNAALQEMKQISTLRQPGDAGRFDELAEIISDAFRAYSVEHNQFVHREGRFFHRPDGGKLIPWGINYNLAGFPVQMILKLPCAFGGTPYLPYEEADFRNFRMMGFNTIRLVLRSQMLETDLDTGAVNTEYMACIQQVLDYCTKYEIYVLIDLHNWYTGPDRYVGSENASGPFLEMFFDKMTDICRDEPMVIGYEVIANEPNINRSTAWSLDNPNRSNVSDSIKVRTDWNEWLHTKYGTRAALQQAWSKTGKFKEENRLSDKERWETETILAPHELLRKFPQLGYGDMTRLRDFYEFCADSYHKVMTQLIGSIKAKDPAHLILYNVSHDLQFSKNLEGVKESFPSHLRWWFDGRPQTVDSVNDHYDVINLAHKFRATGLPWYAGETWIFADGAKAFSESLWSGGGLIGWQYFPGEKFAMGVGFDRWMRDHWKIWEELSWFFNHADGFRSAKLAIVISPFAPEPGYTKIINLLGQMDVDYDLITSLTVLRDPEMLNQYEAVILNLTRMDVDAVRNVLKTCTKPVLMAGRMDVDALANWGTGVRPALEGVFFNANTNADEVGGAVSAGSISLARDWFFITDPEASGMKEGFFKKIDFTGWDKLPAPGAWEDEAISQGLYAKYDGLAWYATTVDIPQNLQQQDLTFYAGTIDDQDEIFFNGVSIGKTDSSVPNYWKAERKYRIPQKLIKATGNTLVVRVQDDKNSGGITHGPVEIFPWKYRDEEVVLTRALGSLSAGSLGQVSVAPSQEVITKDQLLPAVETVAKFGSSAALLKKDNFYLYLGGDGIALNASSDAESKIVIGFLTSTQVDAVYPPTPESRDLNVRLFSEFAFIENDTSADTTVDLTRLFPGRKILWYKVMKEPFERREDSGKGVVIPPSGLLGAVFDKR